MKNVPEKKSYRKLERTVRGFANYRRIEILELLHKRPELSVADISEILKINFKTASSHIQRLAIAGFVVKKAHKLNIYHKLTDKGRVVLNFLFNISS